jgi:hypothetical protein
MNQDAQMMLTRSGIVEPNNVDEHINVHLVVVYCQDAVPVCISR